MSRARTRTGAGRTTAPGAVPGRSEVVAMVLATVALTLLSLAHKLSCSSTTFGGTGTFDGNGGSFVALSRLTGTACYSDVQALWSGRHLVSHLFPYVHGPGGIGTTGLALHDGTVEYPTLTGIFVWLTARPVSTDVGFLVSTGIVFVVVDVVITVLLVRVAGRRAWFWCATPPLALYALYNWDVLPVLTTVAGIAVVVAGPARWSPTTRLVVAGALFGLGGAFKLYPVMFAVPLALAVWRAGSPAARRADDTRSPSPTPPTRVRERIRRSSLPIVAAAGVVLLANIPFVILDRAGWFSVFRFQASRPIDSATLSVWYYGLLPFSASGGRVQHVMTALSAGATALGIVAVLVAAAVIGRRTGRVPWVAACGALVCVYMAANKVDSLQYTLWLIPFLAIVRVRVVWLLAYLVADLCAFVGYYAGLFLGTQGVTAATWAGQALAIGVWGRAVLLVTFAVLFLITGARRLERSDRWFAGEGRGTSGGPGPVSGRSGRPAPDRDAAAAPTA